jgi:hypothetical protein
MSSASSAASASIASASSVAAAASLTAFSRTETRTNNGVAETVVIVGGSGKGGSSSAVATITQGSSRPTGNVQSGSGNGDFPHWAIAVIVVLGFLAIVAGGIAAWLIMRRMRQRRTSAANSRNSVNSGTPIMGHSAGGDVHSPLMAEAGFGAAAGAGGLAAGAALHKEEPARADKHLTSDGASTISRAHSESAPFSGADAAIMADAFRKALRKPEFPAGVEEGDTPDSQKDRREAELLGAELATEGRDLRSVGSSRDVRVQSASDHGHDDRSTVEGV